MQGGFAKSYVPRPQSLVLIQWGESDVQARVF